MSNMLLNATESVVLVSPCSMNGVAGLRQVHFNLEAQGYPTHRILFIANAVSEPSGLTQEQWCRVMSCEPFARIPFDPGSINRAAAEGRTLSDVCARSAGTGAVQQLAINLCEFLRRRPACVHAAPHFNQTSETLDTGLATK